MSKSPANRFVLKMSSGNIGPGLKHLKLRVALGNLGNGRNTVSRVLFRTRELTEFCGKLGEFCEKLGEFAFTHK